jgi:hypothetical protein
LFAHCELWLSTALEPNRIHLKVIYKLTAFYFSNKSNPKAHQMRLYIF